MKTSGTHQFLVQYPPPSTPTGGLATTMVIIAESCTKRTKHGYRDMWTSAAKIPMLMLAWGRVAVPKATRGYAE